MTDDDWAPLPEHELCDRPGEAVDLAKRAAPPPPPPPPPRPARAAARAAAAPDPAAERALAALKAKLAAAPPATSFVAEAQHRELRDARRHRACALSELAALHVKGEDPDAKPVVEYATGADGRDEREESDWYRALPEKEQERLRREWTAERCRFLGAGKKRRERLLRVTAHGALVMGALGILQALLLGGFALVPLMILAGGVAALVAELCRGDRFVYSLAGGLAWVVVMGPTVLVQPFAMPGLLMAAYGIGAVGMEGEMRRSGGFDASR